MIIDTATIFKGTGISISSIFFIWRTYIFLANKFDKYIESKLALQNEKIMKKLDDIFEGYEENFIKINNIIKSLENIKKDADNEKFTFFQRITEIQNTLRDIENTFLSSNQNAIQMQECLTKTRDCIVELYGAFKFTGIKNKD